MRQLLFLIGLSVLCACSATAQDAQGVYPESRPSEIGVGYTFVRFYEVPNTTPDNSGFTLSGAYYLRKWIAADFELTDTFGTQAGQRSQFLFTGAGARFRVPTNTGLQFWVHGLVGDAYSAPKTAYGNQSALGYEGGAGIDIRHHRSRIVYRLSADIVGTRFFGTYQYSPKISAGVVFKF